MHVRRGCTCCGSSDACRLAVADGLEGLQAVLGFVHVYNLDYLLTFDMPNLQYIGVRA